MKSQYTLEQVSSFVETAEHGSFSKAARINGKDRTTISDHVNNLEIALNTLLFIRQSNKLVLTEHGAILLRWSQSLLQYADSFQLFANSLSLPEKSHFCVAIDMHLPNDFFLATDSKAKELNRLINIDWIYKNKKEAVEGLMSGTLDAAITLKDDRASKLIPPGNLMACYLGEIRGRLYTSVDSPLQKLSPVDFRDLSDSKRYLLQSTSELGIGERASYSGSQVVLSSIELIVKFLERDGWAYLPSIEMLENNPKIKELDASFLNNFWTSGHTLVSRRDISGSCYSDLLKAIKSTYKSFFL